MPFQPAPVPRHFQQPAYPTPTQSPFNVMLNNPAASPAPTPPIPIPSNTPAPPPQPVVAERPEPVLERHFQPTGDPTKHGSWPPRWNKLLELARTFALGELLFAHGFPTSYNIKNQAGEALNLAWKVYHLRNKDHVLLKYNRTSLSPDHYSPCPEAPSSSSLP